jgi:hypothetical protein
MDAEACAGILIEPPMPPSQRSVPRPKEEEVVAAYNKSLDFREDLTGEKWEVLGEVPVENGESEYRLKSQSGGGEVIVRAPDIYSMDEVAFWEAVDNRQPAVKLEALIDSDQHRAIETIFPLNRPHAAEYVTALNAFGTNGWTPLFRAVILERKGATVGALVLAGANIAAKQRKWLPPTEWTPVAVALASGNESQVEALFLNTETLPKIVVAAVAAAAVLDTERPHRSSSLVRIIQQSPAHVAATRSLGVAFLHPPAYADVDRYTSEFLAASNVDLWNGWIPLLRALFGGDLDLFEQQAARAPQAELNRCEEVLRVLVPLLPNAKWSLAWNRLQSVLRARLADGETQGGRVV